MVLGYEYQYRDGSKSTTQWGPVSNGIQSPAIYPAFKDISEHTHILKFDLDYEADDARITDSFHGEWYSLTTGEVNDSFDRLGSAGGLALTTADERQSHFQGANTVNLEKHFTGWLFASRGYLYSQFNGDAAVDVATINLAPPATPAPGGTPRESSWSGIRMCSASAPCSALGRAWLSRWERRTNGPAKRA